MRLSKGVKSKVRRDADAPDEPERDPWFNPHLSPGGSTRAHEVVIPVVKAVEQYERKRALRSKDRHTLYRVLIPLTANLIQHYLNGSPGQGIPVPRSNKALGKKGNRYLPFSFPRSFPKMLDALSELGFADEIVGKYSGMPGKSKRTTVKAGAKLIALIEEHKVALEDLSGADAEEVIILKRAKRGRWDEGERLDYRDTATTRHFRNELNEINAWLTKADISFDATAYDRPVNIQARKLFRIFTRGRFDSGGRLFGGFWENLPKPVRLRGIRIEREAVVGLDYSQLNPILAYHIAAALPPPGDAYTLPGLEKHRDGVKKIFNAMLFNRVTQFPRGARKGPRPLFQRSVKCSDVTDAILKRHPKLKGVLSSFEIGHQLQFTESEIMMRVLRECLKRNIVALPVFDCIVVKASAEGVATELMKREFKAVTHLNVTVKRELLQSGNLKADVLGEIDPSSDL
jgi:hypothetical protein